MPAVTITPQRRAARSAQAAQTMRDAKPLAHQGQRSKEPATITRGRSVAYLASRIRRDRPDIADRVQAGEFYSIRSAAVAAGIIKTSRAAI